jgi:hypothetical protein
MKRVAIVQSNYIPWRGYFDIIGMVDEFVIYDVVQFTKRDWRNRNRIKTGAGVRWLTIPVTTAGAYRQTIADARICDSTWSVTHWRTLSHAYAHAPHFRAYREEFAAIYEQCGRMDSLSSVNRLLIRHIARALGFRTRITNAEDYAISGDDRNGRLIDTCRAVGATTYVSGPSARVYLDAERFALAGLTIEYMDYSWYRPYPQLHGAFEPSVSVLDLLFNVGPEAPAHLLSTAALRSWNCPS